MSKRHRRLRWNRVIAAMISAALVATAAYLILDSYQTMFPSAAEQSEMSESVQTVEESSEPEEVSEEVEAALPEGWKWTNLPESALHQGELILVNNEIPFQGENPETISIYEKKTDRYQVKDTLVTLQEIAIDWLNTMLGDFYAQTGLTDVMVISGWRDPDKQDSLYTEDLAETGLDYSTLVAKPGYSEHHTGYAMDLGLLPEVQGVGRSYDGEGAYKWINEHCSEYGFILRYPADKTEITGIEYEPWHFRYVGFPHAKAITEAGYCLEEYIEFLKQYPVDGTHYQVDGYDISWQQAEKGTDGMYRIAVPDGVEYSISGDNSGGIIITFSKEE